MKSLFKLRLRKLNNTVIQISRNKLKLLFVRCL